MSHYDVIALRIKYDVIALRIKYDVTFRMNTYHGMSYKLVMRHLYETYQYYSISCLKLVGLGW
jgi:hypothetical protein